MSQKKKERNGSIPCFEVLDDHVGGLEAFIDSSVSGPDSIRTVDPYPDPGGQNLQTKVEKIYKFYVLKC
jgi:hypothetical protein